VVAKGPDYPLAIYLGYPKSSRSRSHLSPQGRVELRQKSVSAKCAIEARRIILRDQAGKIRGRSFGSLLIWNSDSGVEERIAREALRPTLWVVDGQQRTTALAILFGRKPYWWPSAEDWDKTVRRYDIRFDVNAKEAPFVLVANAAIRKACGDRCIPLSRLLLLDSSRETSPRRSNRKGSATAWMRWMCMPGSIASGRSATRTW
jgi:hypothetical protein